MVDLDRVEGQSRIPLGDDLVHTILGITQAREEALLIEVVRQLGEIVGPSLLLGFEAVDVERRAVTADLATGLSRCGMVSSRRAGGGATATEKGELDHVEISGDGQVRR